MSDSKVLRETKPSAASSMGRLLKNKPKNRFANLLPCKIVEERSCTSFAVIYTDLFVVDHSRVKLIGNEQLDYINASHVKVRTASVLSAVYVHPFIIMYYVLDSFWISQFQVHMHTGENAVVFCWFLVWS